MTPEQIEQERAAFKAWHKETFGYLPKKYKDGTFMSSSRADEASPQDMFEGWLARAEQGSWIKNAKDSRPKYYGRNIVSTKLGNVFVADYDKHFCRWEMGGKIIDGVTHWQPLPQPPAGDHT